MAKHNGQKPSDEIRALIEAAGMVEDMGLHISDALAVVSVGQRKYLGDENGECVGVLDLMEHELQAIEEYRKKIMTIAPHSKLVEKYCRRQPCKTS